jgi:hypothetical protein
MLYECCADDVKAIEGGADCAVILHPAGIEEPRLDQRCDSRLVNLDRHNSHAAPVALAAQALPIGGVHESSRFGGAGVA